MFLLVSVKPFKNSSKFGNFYLTLVRSSNYDYLQRLIKRHRGKLVIGWRYVEPSVTEVLLSALRFRNRKGHLIRCPKCGDLIVSWDLDDLMDRLVIHDVSKELAIIRGRRKVIASYGGRVSYSTMVSGDLVYLLSNPKTKSIILSTLNQFLN